MSKDRKPHPIFGDLRVRKAAVRLVRGSDKALKVGAKTVEEWLGKPSFRITSYNVCYTKLLRKPMTFLCDALQRFEASDIRGRC